MAKAQGKDSVAGPESVLEYLGRQAHRVAISNGPHQSSDTRSLPFHVPSDRPIPLWGLGMSFQSSSWSWCCGGCPPTPDGSRSAPHHSGLVISAFGNGAFRCRRRMMRPANPITKTAPTNVSGMPMCAVAAQSPPMQPPGDEVELLGQSWRAGRRRAKPRLEERLA